jgi:hypothetical protein
MFVIHVPTRMRAVALPMSCGGQGVVVHLGGEDGLETRVLRRPGHLTDVAGTPAGAGDDGYSQSLHAHPGTPPPGQGQSGTARAPLACGQTLHDVISSRSPPGCASHVESRWNPGGTPVEARAAGTCRRGQCRPERAPRTAGDARKGRWPGIHGPGAARPVTPSTSPAESRRKRRSARQGRPPPASRGTEGTI